MAATNKKSAIGLLRTEKVRLQVKADALTFALEENFKYMQDNAGSLLGNTVYNAVEPKLPPFLQGITASLLHKDNGVATKNRCSLPGKKANLASIGAVADQAVDIIPFFLKGTKGIIASFLVKKLLKLALKK